MVELHEHQELALSRLKNGAVLTGDVGSGKSIVAVAYYNEHERPKNVVVITTAKKRDSLDWDREFIRFGVSKHVGGVDGGILEVDSWNNLHQYVGRRDTFFIFDEQRVVGTGAWSKDFIRITQGSGNRWLLLSATPGDTWLDYIPIFIAHGFYKNRTEFLREHVVFTRFAKFPKVDRYIGVNRLVKQRNQILVPMPFVRHTERIVRTIAVDYDTVQFERVLKDRWNIYESRPLRDVAELFMVMRKVVNSSSSRTDQLLSLMSKHPRLVVFYNFDYELMALRNSLASTPGDETQVRVSAPIPKPAGIPSSRASSSRIKEVSSSSASAVIQKRQKKSSIFTKTTSKKELIEPFLVAEWNGHKHQEVPTSDRWVYLVQYQAGAEGWNCITTDAMVFYSLTYSYKNWHQAFGRIDRLNTPFTVLHYYVFMSNSIIDKAIWKALEGKKSFNERSFLGRIKDTASQKSAFSS